MRKEIGVHRGKIDEGRLSLLANSFPFLTDIRIEGSCAEGARGSRYTDIDVSAKRPKNLSEEQIKELEKIIQDLTGIDFYFR